MSSNKARKFQVTINNPTNHSLSRENLISICNGLNPVYYCMCDEVGLENHTPHTHIYIIFDNPRAFSSLIKSFNNVAHIEKSYGNNQENYDYIRKEGKYADDPKTLTNLKDTFYEFGTLPNDTKSMYEDIIDLAKCGTSAQDIIDIYPKLLFKKDMVKRLVEEYRSLKFADTYRKLKVSYIFGQSRKGKTRYIMDKYGYRNVYLIDDYEHPFDNYQGQDIIVFEEYNGQIKIEKLLRYLDGYPLMLPCRYYDKPACFTRVFFTSNVAINSFYDYEQRCRLDTWYAFLNRVTDVIEFKDSAKFYYSSPFEYLNGSGTFFDEVNYE